MKRTEATDEAVESNDQVPASGHDAAVDKTLTMDQRRRRLVRGAAALAPLVLTLRSGALAAASCTGAVQLVNGTDPFELVPPATPNDVCVTYTASCSDGQKISSVIEKGSLVEVSPATTPRTYNCNGAVVQLTGPVAILSGRAAGSLGV